MPGRRERETQRFARTQPFSAPSQSTTEADDILATILLLKTRDLLIEEERNKGDMLEAKLNKLTTLLGTPGSLRRRVYH